MKKTLQKIAWLGRDLKEFEQLDRADLFAQVIQDTDEARACLKRISE